MQKSKLWLAGSLALVLAGTAMTGEVKEGKPQGEERIQARKMTLPVWCEGKMGKGLRFDGTGGKVICKSAASLSNIKEAISIAFWIKGKDWVHCATFVEKAVESRRAYAIQKRGIGTDGVYFWLRDDLNAVWPVDMFKIGNNEWNHIAFTYDSRSPLVKAYLNGKLMVSGNLKETYPNLGSCTLPVGTNDLILSGGDCASSSYLDEVYIYNRALTDEEIGRIYNNKDVPKEGLAGLWKFEEGEGATVADLSGNGNTGRLSQILLVDDNLSEIKKSIEVLSSLIQKAESAGLSVPYQKISLNVARVFVDFIKIDAKDEVQEKAAIFELETIPKIVKQAIKEVEEVIKNPALQVKVPEANLKNLTVKNGSFYCGDIPVFLNGILDCNSPEIIKKQKSLGANFFGCVRFPNPSDEIMAGWDKFNEEAISNKLFPYLKAADEENMRFLCYSVADIIPSWLKKEAPDLDKRTFRTIALNIDHPLLGKFLDSYNRELGKYFRSKGAKLIYTFSGEEEVRSDFTTAYTPEKYEQWLREKYNAIDKLNTIWNTGYKDFREAAEKEAVEAKLGKSIKNRATFYDWHSFNQDRLSAYYRLQIAAIKKEDPDAFTSRWSSGILTTAGTFHRHVRGVDIEAAIKMCSISGWDCGITSMEQGENWVLSAEYCLGWKGEIKMCDFAKSVAPGQPCFNPELHSVSETGFRQLGLAPDFLRTGLWLEHFHGLGAHLIWWWTRTATGTPSSPRWFEGDFMTQPQLVEAWGRTMLELNRLAPYVILFPQLERKVRILYSEASCIQSTAYMAEVDKLYESLYFLDYPAGFIAEDQIMSGGLKGCSLLVIPAPTYVKEETALKIKEYQEKGGRIIISGAEAEALKYDEYGRERNTDFLKATFLLSGVTLQEKSAQFDKIMDEAGIERPVRILAKEGRKPWGVEARCAVKDGRKIVYLINLSRESVEVTVANKGKEEKMRELISNKELKIDAPLVLKPMAIMLLELN